MIMRFLVSHRQKGSSEALSSASPMELGGKEFLERLFGCNCFSLQLCEGAVGIRFMASVCQIAERISGNYLVTSISTLLLLTLLTMPCLAQDLPTYSESVAAYRQNISAALPISVEWTVTEYELPTAIELTKVNNSIIRIALEAPDLDENLKVQLQDILASGEETITEESKAIRLRHKKRRHFLWTDGERIHYRYSDDPTRELDVDFGSSLADGCMGINAYSLVPGRVPALRAWQGYAADGETMTGYIGTQDIARLTNRAFLPPLGFIKEEWKRSQQFSILDRWVDESPATFESLPGEIIGGDPTILIRTASVSNASEIVGIRRLSLWCAYDQGFIPRRYEIAYSGGDPTATVAEEYPLRIVERLEVHDIDKISGVFYPRRATLTHFDLEAKWRSAHPSMAKVNAQTPIPYVPVSIRTEEILAVKVNREIPQHWLDLPFPHGTRFEDVDTHELYMEGVPRDAFDRQLVNELTAGTGADRSRVALQIRNAPSQGMFLAINVGALAVLAVFYVYLRRRRGVK